MSRSPWLCLCLAIPIFGACRAPAKEPTGASTLSAASIVPSGPTAAQAERMPHCPNVVPGATTIIGEVPDGIELRITVGGTGASEIQKRAKFLAAAAAETQGKHRAAGHGGGQFGRCPVVMRNTRIEANEIPGGASVVIRPSDPLELDWLRREVEARSAQIAAPRSFGTGMMKLCPNAVPNATTKIVDAPYGVDLKVTEPSAAGVKAIRERAKMLATRGAPRDEERCAAAIPDATLVASDVPGGTSIAIKAKHPEDVMLLRHMVRQRASSYEAPLVR